MFQFISGKQVIWSNISYKKFNSLTRHITKTVVVESVLFSVDLGQAQFNIKTQRQESIGTGSNIRKFQQDASIKMIKEGGVWKVDRVTWGE